MKTHMDALETRDPAAREAALMATLPRLLLQKFSKTFMRPISHRAVHWLSCP